MRIIPTSVHGVLDYLVGILLVAAPWLFGFSDTASAKWTAIVIGIVVLATSLMTNYELGVLRAIPMRMHLGADALVGIVLVISPWIFGFGDEGTNAWLPMVVLGVGEIGAALLSETVPRRDDLARRERHMVGQGV
jgi:SPW repeat